MRIVFFGNNWAGWQVILHLRALGEEVSAVVVHPTPKAKYRNEIVAAANIDGERVLEANQERWHTMGDVLRRIEPDMGISVFFGYLIPPEILGLFPSGCVNLHPALLPYNRGSFPNVWSIVERTPAGATLHYMDSGLDTGDIIAQKPVEVELTDTGETLYRKLEKACVNLFREAWMIVRTGENIPRTKQKQLPDSSRCVADARSLDEIDLSGTYTARDLIDILRARTFPPHRGAYIRDGKRKIYLRLQLWTDENDEAQPTNDDD